MPRTAGSRPRRRQLVYIALSSSASLSFSRSVAMSPSTSSTLSLSLSLRVVSIAQKISMRRSLSLFARYMFLRFVAYVQSVRG
ncbi:unnamed protein product, partial [Musa hybrid cultivar]